MNNLPLTPQQRGTLAALANGIIPADTRDEGAASVEAGSILAARIAAGVNAALYLRGLELAGAIASERHNRGVIELTAVELHGLIQTLRERLPAFFKQLRLDVVALYLSSPDVWQRIGFPGPSALTGGYADFDHPQTSQMTNLKEEPNIP